jgi:hypothetical protein
MLSIVGFRRSSRDLRKIPGYLRNKICRTIPFQEASCILINARDFKRLEWYYLDKFSSPLIIVYLPKNCDDFFVENSTLVDAVIKEGEWELLEAVLKIKDIASAYNVINLIKAEQTGDTENCLNRKALEKVGVADITEINPELNPKAGEDLQDSLFRTEQEALNEALETVGRRTGYHIKRVFF